ncbi:phosphoglucosamine mutase [Methanohalophilus sp.]
MGLFGTNGVRGIANEFITPKFAIDLSRSLGTYLGEGKTVAIGRDTRISGEMLKAAAISGLLSAGIKVIDIGTCPTPSVQYYVRDHADAGIVITASHNPREYNGIKLIDADGTEFSREGEKKVENIYYSREFHTANWNLTGELNRDYNANYYYINGIIASVNSTEISEKQFRVAIDTGCGAGSLTLPLLLRKLGCEVITINAQPDGTFPWRNPEPTPDVLGELRDIVKNYDADLGVAQDGDADRAVFFDENGTFIDEEILLSMMAKYVTSGKKGPIVTPVSSSRRMLDIAEKAGVQLHWTAVGSINVARRMMEIDAVFGGEGNGGLIFPEHQHCRDGAMACAKLLDIMATGVKTSEMAGNVPEYHNAKTKVKCGDLKKTLENVAIRVQGEGIEIDTTDGFKIWYEDGWLLIRPSGTEPIVRVFAEAKTEQKANELLERGEKIVLDSIQD